MDCQRIPPSIESNTIIKNLLDVLFTSSINPQSTTDDELLQSCKIWNRDRICGDGIKTGVLAPFMIGVNKSHEMKDSNFIWVEYKGNKVQVSVHGANTDSISLVSLTDLICQNVVNFHVKLAFNRAEREVHFLPIRPENKTWSVRNELKLPEGALFVCRFNGCISYAHNQEIITCNLESSAHESVIRTINSITALAELKDGSLVVGDVDGVIYLRNGSTKLNIRGGITEIHVLDSVHCLIKSSSEEIYLYNIGDSGTVKRVFEKDTDEIYVLEQGFIAVLNNEEIEIWNVQDHQIKKIVFLNTPSNYDNLLRKSIRDGTLVFLPPDILIFPNSLGCEVFLTKLSTSKPYRFHFDRAGMWCVTNMILLCDHTIMYATNTSPSGIHIVTKEGKVVYSDIKITNNARVESLTELIDGSVAVKFEFENSVSIIMPKRRDEDYRQYRQYINYLWRNLKTGNWYQARRFYEKSRKIFPDSYEPIALFLQQLEQTPHNKIEKRIQLDRYEFYKKYFKKKLTHKSQRICKNRLFIGEGYFSYTEALINKHSDTHGLLSRALWATELLASPEEIQERLHSLRQRGVTVIFGIDGRTVHVSFRGSRFERIQWNCPFGDPFDREAFRLVIPKFFRSCNQLQIAGDRVQVVLMEGWRNEQGGEQRQWENPIVLGSTAAGYRLIRKRNFGSERYPGYEHTITGRNNKYNAGGKQREYIFEKVYDLTSVKSVLKRADVLKEPTEKNFELKPINGDNKSEDLENLYFDCSTDEDSSDYYDSD